MRIGMGSRPFANPAADWREQTQGGSTGWPGRFERIIQAAGARTDQEGRVA